MNYPDRRETLAKLEEEELRLKSQIRNEFRNITKKEVPVMVVSEEEIKQIKKNTNIDIKHGLIPESDVIDKTL